MSPSPMVLVVENRRKFGLARITRFWSSRVSLPDCFQHALDHEHHIRSAGVVLVEHQGDRPLQRPGQHAFAKLGHLFAVAQHDGVLADQVDTRDMAVEVHPDQGPVQPRGHLLDVRRLAGAVVALDHHPPVEGEPGADRQRGLRIETVGLVEVGHVLVAGVEGGHQHVGIDAEHLAHRDLAGGRQGEQRIGFGMGGGRHEGLLGSMGWAVNAPERLRRAWPSSGSYRP